MRSLIGNHLKVVIVAFLVLLIVSGATIFFRFWIDINNNVNSLKVQNAGLKIANKDLRIANLAACYNSDLSRLQSNNFTYLLFVNYQQGVNLDKSLVNNPTIRQIYTPEEIHHLLAQAAAIVRQFVLISPVRCTGQLNAQYHSPEPITIVDKNGNLTPQAKHVIAIGQHVLHASDPGEAVRQVYR